MTSYRVTWEIDVEADSPREAAEKARAIQIRDGTMAVIFGVTGEDGTNTQIDLLEPDSGRITPGEFLETIGAGYIVAWDGDEEHYVAEEAGLAPPHGDCWIVPGFKTEREAWASCENHRTKGEFLAPAHALEADGYEVRRVAPGQWVFDNNDYGDLGEKAGTFSDPAGAWSAAAHHFELTKHDPNCGRHDGGRCTCDDVANADEEEG